MNQLPNRRDFLKQAALLLPLTTMGLSFSEASSAGMPIKRAGGPHLKPAINVYSFFHLLMANANDPASGIDLFEGCNFAAEQNFHAVDLTGYFFPGYPGPPKDDYVYRLKRHAHNLGLDISGTGIRNNFTAADKGVRAARTKDNQGLDPVAAKLGARPCGFSRIPNLLSRTGGKPPTMPASRPSRNGWPTICANAPTSPRASASFLPSKTTETSSPPASNT